MKRIALIFISLHLLFSCGAERLHQKAVNKGYVHNIYVDTFKVSTVDTMWVEGKPYPGTIYKDSLVPRLEIKYVPKWKVRFDNKRFGDSLKTIREMYEDSLKARIKMHDDSLNAVIKINKQDNKVVIKTEGKRPNLFLLGFITGILSLIIVKYAINKALEKYSRARYK
jgi:hypothetical protein